LKENCRLVIVSSRQDLIREDTKVWLETNYPNIFEEIYLCNNFLLNEESKMIETTKGEICKRIGASLLIDDSLDWVIDCSSKG